MSTEPSALTKAIHHGGGGLVALDGYVSRGVQRAIHEEFVLIDRAELPEVRVNSAGAIVCGGLFLHPSGEPAKRAREYAAPYLAIAAHIEAGQSAEKVAAENLTKRRDELAREFTADTRGTLSGACGYDGLLPWTRSMVDALIERDDRIAELESRP